jgi:hypothetical protein
MDLVNPRYTSAMQRRPLSIGLATFFASTVALGACAGSKQAETSEPTETTTASATTPSESPNGGVVEGGTVGKELPPELVAELRLQGADTNGRLLTLAPGFVATAECSDCGAPSYLWVLAVRCADTRHCEVLTEQCEGEISRDTDTFVLAFRPVEGAAAEVCAGYSGTFELP